MSSHELKTWPDYWLSLETGAKTFEIRRNDRSFQPGDDLLLREWDPSAAEYTGRWLWRRVTYVLRDAERFGLRDGFVVLGLARVCDKCGEAVGYVLCDPCSASVEAGGDA